MDGMIKADEAGTSALAFYNAHAETLADGYEALSFGETHTFLRDLLTGAERMRVLDVGAGTGRDAAGMAALGHSVVAVEPSSKMLALARQLHSHPSINWLADALPGLHTAVPLAPFDLVVLSAVWMHVAPARREEAMASIAGLLAPEGIVYATLRVGLADRARGMHRTSVQEFRRLANHHHLRLRDLGVSADLLGRPEVSWRTLVLEKGS